ncbi:uncharacterized protein LOC111368205 [Olea europaea var. sylvestris]|uniref:uncharacterized protein LOC111368205 n=1 Tax=Olea europaea var. sylvestris TaxID=158386 RepID=UPI000C1D3580|nr:uncharacterized protein LOC111368205 [Olea europaea var. sylvestris]
MINSITVNGIHKPKSQDDKLAMLDTGYITNVSGLSIQLKIEMLTATLRSLGYQYQSSGVRVYRAEDSANVKNEIVYVQLRDLCTEWRSERKMKTQIIYISL